MNLRDSLIFFEDNFLSISNTGGLSPCAMDEYSRHEGLLKGLEEKRLQNRIDPRYCLPLLYCLMENKKRALEICEYYLKQNPNSRAYTLFCDKFKQYVMTII